MKIPNIVILLGILLSSTLSEGKYYEKECSCTPWKLWLDVVIVIDNSLGMPENEFAEALSIVGDVFDPITITQGEGHHTRVGMVTYTSQASIMASEGCYFSSVIPNIPGEIQQSLCKANCFCKERWLQYKVDTEKYGTRLRIGGFKLDWENAKDACIHLGGGSGYLATVLDNYKHNFIAMLIKNDSRTDIPYRYHIGLSYDKSRNAYFWERPKDSFPERIPLEDFRKWNKGYPSLDGDKYCVLTAQNSTEFELGWQNEVCNLWSTENYVCKMIACDTNNFCSPI